MEVVGERMASKHRKGRHPSKTGLMREWMTAKDGWSGCDSTASLVTPEECKTQKNGRLQCSLTVRTTVWEDIHVLKGQD